MSLAMRPIKLKSPYTVLVNQTTQHRGFVMKKNLTELVFILDRSGSMQGLEGDTIGGFNAMIKKQQKEPGEAFVSTVLFDDQTEVLHDRVKVSDVQPITEKEYYVRGCTALLDAIGGAIHHIGNIHKYARPEDVPEHTFSLSPPMAWRTPAAATRPNG